MRTAKNDQVYPFFTWNEAGYGDAITIYDSNGGKQHIPYTEGLTKREYYASQAMASLLRAYEARDKNTYLFDINDTIPQVAVIYADRLIEELNRDK